MANKINNPVLKPHPIWKNVVFSLLSFTLLLGLATIGAEIILRIRETRRTIPMYLQNPHGSGSFRLKSRFTATRTVDGRSVTISTNQHGMHWYPTEHSPLSGRQRIAFVGDSFTFGSWADRFQNSFVGVFNAAVNAEGFEALNFGVGGYGIDDMELIIKEEVVNFQPSVVVLMFFCGNNFRDTYLGIEKYNVQNGTCLWDKNVIRNKLPPENCPPELQEKTSNGLSPVYSWFRSHFAIARTLSKLNRKRVNQAHIQNKPAVNEMEPSQEPGLIISQYFTYHTYWSQKPYPPLAMHAIDITLASLERIHNVLEQNGVALLIVCIPYRDQVSVKNVTGDNYDMNLPQEFIEVFAQEQNIGYLDLLPLLREHVKNGGEFPYIHEDPHFNNTGHRVVGESLADWFLKNE